MVSANRELVALGTSAMIGSIFGAFVAFGSLPRTKGERCFFSLCLSRFSPPLLPLPFLTSFRLAMLECHAGRTDTGDRNTV